MSLEELLENVDSSDTLQKILWRETLPVIRALIDSHLTYNNIENPTQADRNGYYLDLAVYRYNLMHQICNACRLEYKVDALDEKTIDRIYSNGGITIINWEDSKINEDGVKFPLKALLACPTIGSHYSNSQKKEFEEDEIMYVIPKRIYDFFINVFDQINRTRQIQEEDLLYEGNMDRELQELKQVLEE